MEVSICHEWYRVRPQDNSMATLCGACGAGCGPAMRGDGAVWSGCDVTSLERRTPRPAPRTPHAAPRARLMERGSRSAPYYFLTLWMLVINRDDGIKSKIGWQTQARYYWSVALQLVGKRSELSRSPRVGSGECAARGGAGPADPSRAGTAVSSRAWWRARVSCCLTPAVARDTRSMYSNGKRAADEFTLPTGICDKHCDLWNSFNEDWIIWLLNTGKLQWYNYFVF